MPSNGPSRFGRPRLMGAASVLLGVALCACSGGGGDGAGQTTEIGSIFTGRPRVAVSAAENFPGSGVDQLDFFDALEKRDLVSYDDALHASLLLFVGQSGETFVQRAGRAKQMGLIDAKFDQPPREAITVEELAGILAAGMHRPSAGSDSRALEDMKALGVFPDFATPNAGVSGGQLLTIMGHAEDAMARGESLPSSEHGALMHPASAAEREGASAGMFALQPANRKPLKKPPIDLDKDAKKPRPGQVLPEGGGTPAGESPSAEPSPAPAPAPGANEASPAPAKSEVTPAESTPAPAPSPAPAAPARLATRKPLPPPRAEGGVPSRVDGIASDLRYVALDKVKAEATEVMGPGEFVQWRAVDDGRGRPGDWQTLEPGTPINDRMEIRTGLGARVTLKVGDSATVVVHRLSRIRLEEKIRSDGRSQLGVTIYRGMVEASAKEAGGSGGEAAAIYVKTPDQVFPLRTRALFEYDSYRGTVAREFRS